MGSVASGGDLSDLPDLPPPAPAPRRARARLRPAAGDASATSWAACLRDRALGLPSHDIDAVVAGGAGREIAERLAAALPARLVLLGGKDFAAYRLVGRGPDGRPLGPRRHVAPRRPRPARLHRQLLRPRPGGRRRSPIPSTASATSARRILRATTPASFTGDPLRVLRLPRLLLRLPGFAADPETFLLARASSRRTSWTWRPSGCATSSPSSSTTRRPTAGSPCWWPSTSIPASGWARPASRAGRAARWPSSKRCRSAAASCGEVDADAADAGRRPRPPASPPPSPTCPAATAALPLDRLERFRDAGYLTRQAAAEVALLLGWEELPDERSRPAPLPPPRRPALGHGRRSRWERGRQPRPPSSAGAPGCVRSWTSPAREGDGALRSAAPADRRRGAGAAGDRPRAGGRPRAGRGAPGAGGRPGADAGGGGGAAGGRRSTDDTDSQTSRLNKASLSVTDPWSSGAVSPPTGKSPTSAGAAVAAAHQALVELLDALHQLVDLLLRLLAQAGVVAAHALALAAAAPGACGLQLLDLLVALVGSAVCELRDLLVLLGQLAA